MTNAASRKLVAFAAVFTVRDVGRSLDYYRGRLGFREFFRLGDPPSYAIVERDAVSLHLMPASQEARGLGRSSIYVFAASVDDLHAELLAQGCTIETCAGGPGLWHARDVGARSRWGIASPSARR